VTGFGIAFLFLFVVLQMETQYSIGKILVGSLTGAFLITAGTLSSLITVAGLSSLVGVNLTGKFIVKFCWPREIFCFILCATIHRV